MTSSYAALKLRLDQALSAHRLAIQVIAFVILAMLFAVGTWAQSVAKPLWYDELFTYHIARLATPADMWAAVQSGIDNQPPAYYLAVWLLRHVVASDVLAVRLPAMLGFGLMCLCLYGFVARRAGQAAGLVAALVPALTSAYLWAYEARPYAPAMGFCSAALLCWQQAGMKNWKPVALIGLAVSIALALLSRYDAAPLVAVLALIELARTLERKQIDYAVWASIVMGTLTLLICLPLILSARGFAGLLVSESVSLISAYNFYLFLFDTFRFSLFGLALIVAIVVAVSRRTPAPVGEAGAIPRPELLAALLMALYPVYSFILAVTVVKGFEYRYALPAVIGVSLLIAYGVYGLGRLNPLSSSIATVAVVGLFGLTALHSAPALSRGEVNPMTRYPLLTKAESNLPIVLPDYETYLQASYYAPESFAPRLIYLINADSDAVHIDDLLLSRLQQIAQLKVYEYQAFTVANSDFLVYIANDRSWFMQRILADNGQVLLIEQSPTDKMYRVHLPND